MPTKNTVKTYVENAYYHLYNRGVDKREIFLDEQDCKLFLHFLKIYLSPIDNLQRQLLDTMPPQILFKMLNKNISKEVSLLSFALMPNHFHLQIKQISINGIEKLMRRVLTSYVQYFNKKYNRIGPLFESTYKAVLVQTNDQNLYLSSYIHRNPMKLTNPKFDFIQFSSYPYYLDRLHAVWLNVNEISSFFKTPKGNGELLSYQNFVEGFSDDLTQSLQDILLEDSQEG